MPYTIDEINASVQTGMQKLNTQIYEVILPRNPFLDSALVLATELNNTFVLNKQNDLDSIAQAKGVVDNLNFTVTQLIQVDSTSTQSLEMQRKMRTQSESITVIVQRFAELLESAKKVTTKSPLQQARVDEIEKQFVEFKALSEEKKRQLAIAEFFSASHEFCLAMHDCREFLQAKIKAGIPVTPALKAYMKKIDQLLETYQKLNFIDSVGETFEPEKIMSSLQRKLVSNEFRSYMAVILKLAQDQQAMVEDAQNNHRDPSKALPKPTRYLAKLSACFANIRIHLQANNLDSVSSRALQLTQECEKIIQESLQPLVNTSQQERPEPESKKISPQKLFKRYLSNLLSGDGNEVILFQALLNLNLNNSMQGDADNLSLADFDSGLKELLLEAYPDDFGIDDNGAFKTKRKTALLEALGVADINNIKFDYKKFNATSLKSLEQSSPHMLWTILKSTLPVTDDFSAAEKIQAYRDVAAAFYDGKIGAHDKYLGALDMAKAAYAIAKEHPTAKNITLAKIAFKPLAAHITTDQAQLIGDKQFGNWIIDKVIEKKTPQTELDQIHYFLSGDELTPEVLSLSSEADTQFLNGKTQQSQSRLAAFVDVKSVLITKLGGEETLSSGDADALGRLTELVENNEFILNSLLTFYHILLALKDQEWIEKSDKTLCENYLRQVVELIRTYELCQPQDLTEYDSVGDLVSHIAQAFEEDGFNQFAQQISTFTIQGQATRQIELTKYRTRMGMFTDTYQSAISVARFAAFDCPSLVTFSFLPLQKFLKYNLLLKELSKNFPSECKNAISIVEGYTKTINANQHIQDDVLRLQGLAAQFASEQMQGLITPKAKEIGLLKAILALNLNSPSQQSASNALDNLDSYLKQLLVLAYPDDFNLEHGLFTIKNSGQLSQEGKFHQTLLTALGVTLQQNTRRQIVLEPKQFDAYALDLLIKSNVGDTALWAVLKTTIPVSSQFTPTDKVNAYVAVAGEFYQQHIGETAKYLGAYAMAKAAIAIRNEYPKDNSVRLAVNRAFSVDSNKLNSVETQKIQARCTLGQYGDWIVGKAKQHQPLFGVNGSKSEEITTTLQGIMSSPERVIKRKQISNAVLITAGLGGLIGVGLGVFLTMTGLFAPFGVGFMVAGLTALVYGFSGLALGGLVGVAIRAVTRSKSGDFGSGDAIVPEAGPAGSYRSFPSSSLVGAGKTLGVTGEGKANVSIPESPRPGLGGKSQSATAPAPDEAEARSTCFIS